MPNVDPTVAKRLWRAAMRLVRQALLDGNSVVLEEICTIQPYVKKASRGYSLTKQQVTGIPAVNYVRFEPSVRFVKALKEKPVQET